MKGRVLSNKIVILSLAILVLLITLPYLIPLPANQYLTAEELAPEEGEFISIDNYEGFFIEINPDSENVIVFIHGFGSSSSSWYELMNSMVSEDLRMIAIDLKGFGMTEKSGEIDLSHQAQAEYVTKILDEVNVQDAHFVGHSMGGNVISVLAGAYPERIKSLTYVDAAIIEKNIPFTWVADLPVISRYLQQFLLRSFDRERIGELLNSAYYTHAATDEMIDIYYAPLQIESWEKAMIGIIRDMGKNKVDIDNIDPNTKTLILWGEEDSWVPTSRIEPIKEHFKNYEISIYDNVGHVPQEEAVDRIKDDLVKFLVE